MNYNNTKVRRQDRLLDEQNAIELLKIGEYGVLSMQDEENGAYGIPLNYAWDGDSSVYIHCAQEGKKLKCIEQSNSVSFCVVGKTNVLSDKFTTEFESIILKCKACIGLAAEERMKALEYILDKYSPEDKVIGMKYAEKSFAKTEVIKLEIIEFSGKCKSVS